MHNNKELDTDAVIVGFYEDVRPLKGTAGALDWILCGSLSRLILQNKMRGSLGDVALLTSKGKIPADKIFLVGLGSHAALSPASLRAAACNAAASAVSAGVARAALDCFPLGGELSDEAIAAVRKGLTEGAGTHPIDFTMLASDDSSRERMSRLIRAWPYVDRRS